MKILVVTQYLDDFAGTELFVLDLVKGLKKRGHKAFVFSPVLGGVAKEIKKADIPITDNISDYRNEKFDIIHAQHHPTTILARAAFPDTPMIFMSHGVLPDIEQPPPIDLGISGFVAVSEEVKNHLGQRYNIPGEKITIVRNGVDLNKFKVKRKTKEKLESILVISNRYNDQTRETIEGAARSLGASLLHIGLPENPVCNTLPFIEKADLVISLGCGSLEAMACARNVVVYDINGGDGFIDEKNFFEVRKNNFSGRRFHYKYNQSDLAKELLKYNPKIGEKLRKIVTKEQSLENTIQLLLEAYKSASATDAKRDLAKWQKAGGMKKLAEFTLKKELAFDQYGRYALIQKIIDNNRNLNEKVKVLDIGGRGNILKKFLPEDEVFYLDPNVDTNDKNYIRGEGCLIPEDNGSFDWVVSADVFEHIPKPERGKFLSENLRVARKGVVLVAPFYSEKVQEAEKNANANYKILTGKDHVWLREHIANGLPGEDEIEKALSGMKYAYQKINNNALIFWEFLTNVGFLAAHNFTSDIERKFEALNLYYNSHVFPKDHIGDSYRKVYFIKKDKHLKNMVMEKEEGSDIGALQVIMRKSFSIIDGINNEERQHISNMREDIKNLGVRSQQRIEALEEGLREKAEVIARQNQEILAMQNSKFWKLRNAYVRFGPRRAGNVWRRGITVLRRDGLPLFLRKAWYFIYFEKKIPQQYPEYQKWIKHNERITAKEAKAEIQKFKYKPKISIIVPVYNIDPKWLNRCIESVKNQYYQNWELCLHDDASTKTETVNCLKSWQKVNDSRIKISFGKKNQHISGASNEALKLATGEFIALIDNDDEIAPFALYENVKLLNEHKDADFIYSDEDKMNGHGKRWEPFFKPDWSPELLLSQMYTCHLGLYRKSIVDKIGGFRKGYEGAQDYDLVLRFVERTKPEKIFHIPKVLYHWRAIEGSTARLASDKDYAAEAAQKALRDYLKRNGLAGEVMDGPVPGFHRVRLDVKGFPMVSIIIPFRDKVEALQKCVRSILAKTDYDNYEIILVDNQSREKVTKDYLKEISANSKVRVLSYDKPFCFSSINNYAVNKSRGEYVLLLNNDIEVITGEWLRAMLEQAQKEGVGAVGAKLLYPDGRIQHAGIILGTGIAGHAFKGFQDGEPHYFKHAEVIKNYSGATGACLMVKKSIYKDLGGLNDKALKIAYNDVDFCLRLLQAGYRNVFTPYAKLYHFESYSRGNDEEFKKTNPKEYERVLAEREYMYQNWPELIKNDPYYSPNLTRKHENFGINTDF